MDYTKVLRAFRLVAPAFVGVADSDVEDWIDLTSPLVSPRRFGRLWAQALALLTAHRMKMANVGVAVGDDPLSDVGSMGVGNLMRVANFSEGQVSLGLNHNISQYTDTDAEYALTEYGVQYLSLRNKAIIPILSAGVHHHGGTR
jgi:hypothetical protein